MLAREAVRPYLEGKTTDFIELLRQEHRNFESLLRVLEPELGVFGRGERPDYEVLRAVIDNFKDYPDSCHRPKEDMIVETVRARDAVAAATISGLEAELQEGKKHLCRVAQEVERVLNDQDLLRQNVVSIIATLLTTNGGRAHCISDGARRAAARGLGRYCS